MALLEIQMMVLFFYFHLKSFDEFVLIEDQPRRFKIRWLVIVNLTDSYITLCWNNFTANSESNVDSRSQFPFWNYIPQFIRDLETLLEVEYSYPVFHRLVLEQIWDRYLSDPDYSWSHIAVRAEASGVAVNARSATVRDINVDGLLSLADKLAREVVDALGLGRRRTQSVAQAKNIIIKTLIQDWGTKSYEFKLTRGDEKLFRAHCYFGLKPEHNTQDCFPHFKCYQEFGGAIQTLSFLLEQINNN